MATLKRILEYIQKNSITWLTYLLCLAIFFVFYREVVGIYGTLILLVIFLAYGICMILNFWGLQRFKKYEKSNALSFKRIFRLTFLILAPIYWCWVLLSFVPINAYEVWFITGFPITFISFLPLKEVAGHWENKKIAFWAMQIGIYLLLLTTVQIFVKSFI